MKANKLMVGDLIKTNSHSWNDETLKNKYCKVEMVRQNYLSCSLMDNPERRPYGEENSFDPIPLTPEILEKNGFENIGDDTYQLEEKPCWFWVDFFNHQYGCEYDTSIHEHEDDEHRLKLYGIPSVHELQHALRLCGIEKTIEL